MTITLRKKIKKYGSSAVLILSPEDLDNYGWKIGDYLDISDIVKVTYKKLPKSKDRIKDIKKSVKSEPVNKSGEVEGQTLPAK